MYHRNPVHFDTYAENCNKEKNETINYVFFMLLFLVAYQIEAKTTVKFSMWREMLLKKK